MSARSLIPVLVAVVLAGCGDGPKGGSGESDGPIPFIGRDAKQVVSAFGADGRDVLEAPDRMTLFTLNPVQVADGKLSPEAERLRNYGVLGKAEITDPTIRRRLVEAVYEGLKADGAGPANCFFPRHGLRFEKGEQTIEVLICFECTWVYVYPDGAENETRLLFSAGVKPVFDSVIKPLKLKQDQPK